MLEIRYKMRPIDVYRADEQKPWATDLDAKKFIVDVHMPFKHLMDVDFKTAYFDDKDRELLFTLIPMAQLGMQLCPNPLIGKQILGMDLSLANVLAITKFNVKGNPLFTLFTPAEPEPTEHVGQTETVRNFTDKIKGLKRPRKVQYEDD